MTEDPLGNFSEPTRSWFSSAFASPTPAQRAAWELVASGKDALVIAPTGSGKTLAAFLWSLDRLASGAPGPGDRVPGAAGAPAPATGQRPSRRARRTGVRVLYVSPLKALAFDIERNLRAPLKGIAAAALGLGLEPPQISIGVRTGDTPQEERRRMRRYPPDILITTPESLFLLLTSQARALLAGVETVIVDEVHAVAGTKRGAHLALGLERLDELCARRPQRIGLSATVRPAATVARYLSGTRAAAVADITTTEAGTRLPAEWLDLSVSVPLEDITAPGEGVHPLLAAKVEPAQGYGDPEAAVARRSMWPHLDAALLELIQAQRSTIVFANSRRLAERLCARLNDLAGKEIARAHHGSVAGEQRVAIEEELKAGRLPAVVATSSLELGIDMGAVDLVVQVGAPDSVASGLQRVGRAGHHVGAVSRGIFFPRYRGDLLAAAVVAERMRLGLIEELAYPNNPLDVLAQQVVAMVAMDDWDVDSLARLIRRAASFAELPLSALNGVLDMLSGRYPSDEFAELRPRLNWDRTNNELSARRGAQYLAVVSGGTIPDRGLYGVFLAGEGGSRVGELDEEMVYESRIGEVFVLGASSWLIEDITPDRVLVSPAPGRAGKMPFWHGDAPGRPVELGRALGEFVRELQSQGAGSAQDRLRAAGLDDFASGNLLRYLQEQRQAAGTLPDDKTIVVERFRDELGDWRVCIHSFFGARVHAPWAQAVQARLAAEYGVEVQCIYSDDGIVVRLPETDEIPEYRFMVFESEDVEDIVIGEVGNSALFASRFREAAARSLLLPRRRPGRRTPLWQQRQKSAGLLQVASHYLSFPILLETFRECLQDVFDVPALVGLMEEIARREVRVVEVETAIPSPFASSLQFGYVSAFLYEGDAPLAERRAQALSLDRSLLSELLGRDELRELIDEESLTTLERELQHLTQERKARHADDVHDILRDLGDLDCAELAARCAAASLKGIMAELTSSGRALSVRVGGAARFIAAQDLARYRDALGVAPPVGVPGAWLEPVADPLGELVARWARTHGPFTPTEPALRLGLGPCLIADALARLAASGRVVQGEFRPGGSGTEWIDAGVLRRLRRRSLAAWRKEVEPVPPEALARFELAWHGIGRSGAADATPEALYEIIGRLQGAAVPASTLERQVLPVRLSGYSPALLDELCASGEVVWSGRGSLGADDGWVCLALAESAPALLPRPTGTPSPRATRVLEELTNKGALFFRQLAQACGIDDDRDLLDLLWELVWAGRITNDTLAPLRGLLGSARGSSSRARPRRPVRRLGPPAGAGRWSLVPAAAASPTERLAAAADQLLQRHGVVTRAAVAAEGTRGGFAAVYPVLKAMEEAGKIRRGYFVEGLGGAQFAGPASVDRMRALSDTAPRDSAEVLAATDPASVYGAALPWPERGEEKGHRAGRKAGAVVVLVSGRLVLYAERGGRSLLSYSDDQDLLQLAVEALALAVRDGVAGVLNVERADGGPVLDSALAPRLEAAGFSLSSRGLRLRA